MSKTKIAISIDKDLLDLMDLQRGNESRSSYINRICKNYYFPEQAKDVSLVTHEELSAQLKEIHGKLRLVEPLAINVKDLEHMVYKYLFDVKDAVRSGETSVDDAGEHVHIRDIRHSPFTDILSLSKGAEKLSEKELNKLHKDLTKFVNRTIKKHGNVKWERDRGEYLKIPNVVDSHVGFTRHMHRCALTYDKAKTEWVQRKTK